MFDWFKRKKLGEIDWNKFNPTYAFQHVTRVNDAVTFPELAEITFHSFDFNKAKDRKEALKFFGAKGLAKADGGIVIYNNDKTLRCVSNEDLWCCCIDWGKYDKIGKI